ncbi:MAG: sulfatase-like hydrolase/transferase [Ignavibacteria bacterium]|nr:sulfatase-like hydrolase/transferase [Ignavibacteria bacterium]
MKKYNIFWFVIDSVRTFRSGLDDRDRLDIMDEFGKDGVEFTNCYTSAPSSLLAAGAMFTGYPSAFIARHFNDWRFKDNNLSTIKTLVDEYGYTSIPIFNTREERQRYQHLLPPFPAKLLPQGSLLSDYGWSNKELTRIFKHIFHNREFPEPFIFNFWYNCRRDPRISDHVKESLQTIKDAGLYDNSIIIMHSDHGYPHPATKLDEGFFRGLGHDMVLTDDNIITPFIIKYSGAPKKLKISNIMGHVDIIPTIFDLLGIEMNKEKDKNRFRGKSLIPIIEHKERDTRIRRSDTRLQMDVGKITMLRSNPYKYIYFHDDKIETLYDLEKDPNELNNLLSGSTHRFSEIVSQFRDLMKDYDTELLEFHKKSLESNFLKIVNKLYLREKEKVLIISPAPTELLILLINFFVKYIPNENITLISIGNTNIMDIKLANKIQVTTIRDLKSIQLKNADFSYSFYLTHNTRRVFLKDEIVKNIKKIESKKKFLMDYNFQIFEYFSMKSFLSYLKLYFNWETKGYYYKEEPLYFIKDLFFYIKHVTKKLINKKKVSNDIMTAHEIMEFRDHHLKKVKQGLDSMKEGEMEYELERIKEWGEE